MFSKLTLVIKPVSSHCNLACDYCMNFAGGAEERKKSKVMSVDTAQALVKQTSELGFDRTKFIWHGGEPTLRVL